MGAGCLDHRVYTGTPRTVPLCINLCQVNSVITFEREGCGFESSHRRSATSLNTIPLTVVPFLKIPLSEVSLANESKEDERIVLSSHTVKMGFW